MKFSLSWLRTHLDTEATTDRIASTLSSIGLEVESVVDPAAPLAPFRTARIVEAVQHPNADRLRVCRVDTGAGEVTVVCGAPNARTGLHAVFAPPGAFIPGSGITLKIGEIRGVSSAGMLVSSREMGLGDEHDGIVELPDGTPAGLPYAAWAGLDDTVIEIGVTPNRGDALSVRGVARDLAAAGLGVLRPWNAPEPFPAAFDAPVRWTVDWPEACPWIVGRSVRHLRNGPSPEWLKRRLVSVGLRPISALVDITNFFTFDLGRPLHVFDGDRIAGGTLTLRRGAGESFRALNGRDLAPGADDLVIADQDGVVSLAGIMGGERTGSQDGTTHAFIECALFDPVTIALAGRRHQLSSDARQRFERGIDPSLLPAALDAATRMVIELCGGEPGPVVSAGAEPAWRRQASMRFERLSGLGGAEVAPTEAAAILERLGFTVSASGNAGITTGVPPWRNDIAGNPALDQPATLDPARARNAAEGAALIEPECDLIEEVLRIRTLDSIPPVSLPPITAIPAPALSARQSRTAQIRRALAAQGYAECVTFSFLAGAQAALFGELSPSLTLKNPIAADLDQMRPTPLATLALAAARNLARGAGEVALFEVGPGYAPTGQVSIAAALRSGTPPRHWEGVDTAAPVMRAKAGLWALLTEAGVPLDSLSLATEAPGHYHPGQSAIVRQGPRTIIARFGVLHPALLTRLDLPSNTVAYELFLDAVADPKRRRRAAPVLPGLQTVTRDFAFVVADTVPAENVLKAARFADRTLVARVSLFDVYSGTNLQRGEKSLGVEVAFQPRERTMTDDEIEAASTKVIESVAKSTGARLR